mgnify:CR=1 FL=1
MLNLQRKSDLFFESVPSYHNDYLDVGGGHKIYYEQYGNPNGKPVLFLHGGPGAGFSNSHKGFFDPKLFRVIFFDQRGSGKSIPYAEIDNNNTKALLSDIELLRSFLNIDQWYLFGGSWGSTLAILYGIKHPSRALGFILRGIFLGTKNEINWFLYGMKSFFPEAHNNFIRKIPQKERNNILEWFNKNLNLHNSKNVNDLASIWNSYESSCSTLMGKSSGYSGNAPGALSLARIEAHYFVNNMFVSDDYFLGQIDRVRHLPGIVVQGRYDMVCPPVTAFQLYSEWPKLDLKLVPDAGHSAMEPTIRSELIKATNTFRNTYTPVSGEFSD